MYQQRSQDPGDLRAKLDGLKTQKDHTRLGRPVERRQRSVNDHLNVPVPLRDKVPDAVMWESVEQVPRGHFATCIDTEFGTFCGHLRNAVLAENSSFHTLHMGASRILGKGNNEVK